MYSSHSAHTGHQTIYLISSSAGMLCSPKRLGKESESEYFLNSPDTQEWKGDGLDEISLQWS